METNNITNSVILICVKEKSKLRVRIISEGYNNAANCQFPRNIRKEGTKYSVPAEDVSFTANTQMKFFYRIKTNRIKILQNDSENTFKFDKIYEEEDNQLCCVCYDYNKAIVFAPCGHYYCCGDCSDDIKKSTGNCPICRVKISDYVKRENIAM